MDVGAETNSIEGTIEGRIVAVSSLKHNAKLLPILSTTNAAKHPRYKRRRLEETDQRFETFPDPFHNWIVWDRNEDDFAEVRNAAAPFIERA
jgi:hypothetical protein